MNYDLEPIGAEIEKADADLAALDAEMAELAIELDAFTEAAKRHDADTTARFVAEITTHCGKVKAANDSTVAAAERLRSGPVIEAKPGDALRKFLADRQAEAAALLAEAVAIKDRAADSRKRQHHDLDAAVRRINARAADLTARRARIEAHRAERQAAFDECVSNRVWFERTYRRGC